MGYTHLVGDDDRRLVEQLDELFAPVEAPEILCANVRNSNKETLAAEMQRLQIQ
jgi:hypothetical protein